MKINSWIPFSVFSLLLVWLLVEINYQIGINIEYENGYTLGDWLINYEDGGFKRRGLSGSFFIFLYENFGLPIKKTVYAFQFLLYIIFFLGILRLAFKASISFLFLGLIFSAVTFLFMVFEPGSIGRKEILLFAFYVVYLNLLDLFPRNFAVILIYSLLTTIIGILFHEIYFFYLSFFVLPLIFQPKLQFSKKQLVALVIIVGGVSVLITGCIKILGGEINQGNTFEILKARGIGEKMENLGNMGILTWNDNFDKVAYFTQQNYSLYIISFALAILLFYVFSKIENVFRRRYDLPLIIFGTILFSLPAYVLAIDWGRWLHIHFMMLLIFFTYFHRPERKTEITFNSTTVFYLILVILSCLFWRFDLVDRGFYLNTY